MNYGENMETAPNALDTPTTVCDTVDNSEQDGAMASQLFRKETSRRLRVRREQIADDYGVRRPRWMSAFNYPRREPLLRVIDEVADAVARGDIAAFCRFSLDDLESHLDRGVSPILLLAATEVFEDAVLTHLTTDQQRLVRDLFLAVREQQRAVMHDRLLRLDAQGA